VNKVLSSHNPFTLCPARISLPVCIGLLLAIISYPVHASDEPKWIRASSSHFSVLTDVSPQRGEQLLLRLEQMRTVVGHQLMKSKLHLSQPLDVIAVKSDDEYIGLAPVRDGRPISSSGFFLDGDDRDYIVLNLTDDKSWQTITRDFFRLYLNDNYPPTPAWFDTGLIEYFSTVQLTDDEGEIGADPGSYIPLLNKQPWMPLPELLSVQADPKKAPTAIFMAESWIVIHYLLTQDKMSETGTYLGLTEGRREPVEKAITDAYGVSSAQLEQAVKEHLHSFAANRPTSVVTGAGGKSALPPGPPEATKFNPVHAIDIGNSYKDVRSAEARALVDEMMVHLSEHREAGIKDLNDLINGEKTENPIEHRALGWAYMAQGKDSDAVEEFQKTLELDLHDPWAHFYMARMKYRAAVESGDPFQGLANMLIDLRTVLDWDLDFAEAYNMLGVARAEGGGVNSAVDAMTKAVQLSPRNETYSLNMAVAQTAAKNWDAATALLTRLKSSHDAKIAADARNYLDGLPNAKKYGILPPRPGVVPGAKAKAAKKASDEDEDENRADAKAEPAPDRRKTEYAKGKLLRVDCSQPPIAILTLAGARTMRLRTEDFHSLLLIGADQFSCDWKNLAVSVNYKAGGKSDGDLVSLEIRQP
jgi:tetratricopeptide (TPR) repeat protein